MLKVINFRESNDDLLKTLVQNFILCIFVTIITNPDGKEIILTTYKNMKPQEFLEKIKVLADYIENHPQLELIDFGIENPADEVSIQKLIDAGMQDPQVLDFYKQANGVRLQWCVEDETAYSTYNMEVLTMIQGFNFIPIDGIFQDWKPLFGADEDSKFKFLFPFNFFNEDACDCFELAEGKKYDKAEIYHFDIEGKKYKLPLDFNTYLQKLYESKGLWYWFSMFTPDKNPDTEMILSSSAMEDLFPDFDPYFYDKI